MNSEIGDIFLVSSNTAFVLAIKKEIWKMFVV